MIKKPLLSVRLMVYNNEPFIRKTIESVLNQRTDFKFEIVVGDDFSTDRTLKIIKLYKNTEKINIRILDRPVDGEYWLKRKGKNASVRTNFIDIVKNCQGKYIALLDGDDYWTDPLKLQKQVDFLEANEAYSMCFTRFKTKNETTDLIENDNNGHYFVGHEPYIDFNFEKFYKGWHIGTQTVVFKNSPQLLNYFNTYKMPRDVHLYTELLKSGKGACLKDFCAVYRITGKGVYTSISKKNQIKKGAEVYEDIYLLNKDNPYLKLKYRKFLKPYLRQLLADKKPFSFIKEALHCYQITGDTSYLKQDLKMLLKTIKSKF